MRKLLQDGTLAGSQVQGLRNAVKYKGTFKGGPAEYPKSTHRPYVEENWHRCIEFSSGASDLALEWRGLTPTETWELIVFWAGKVLALLTGI